jgi:hypothetical protein
MFMELNLTKLSPEVETAVAVAQARSILFAGLSRPAALTDFLELPLVLILQMEESDFLVFQILQLYNLT